MFSYNTIAAQADIAASASYLWGALTDADQEAFIGARLNQHTYAGSSCYLAGLQIGPADTPVGLILYKRVSGSNTSLGSVVPTGGNVFAINIWYRITLSLIGSAITVTVQRDSDNNYLTSGGTWQSGATAAISVTDSAVSAAGYVGTIQYESGTPLRYMRVDDFVATYVGGGSSHAGPLVGGALIKSLIGKGLVN
jgi:hypothetical protein